MNSCPVDFGQLEFYGISRQNTGEMVPEPITGKMVPFFELFRWQNCTTCGIFTKEDFFGTLLSFQKEVPDKKLFARAKGRDDDD